MNPLAYRVLIIDNDRRPGGFGNSTRLELHEDDTFEIALAYSWEEGKRAIQGRIFDIFVIDVHLGGPMTGLDIARELRQHGFAQPIVLATNNPGVLRMQIKDVEPMLRHGPTTFFQKDNTELTAADVIREASDRTDFFLRALRFLTEAEVEQSPIQIGERTLTASQLLSAATQGAIGSEADREIVRDARLALRDGFATIMARMLGR